MGFYVRVDLFCHNFFQEFASAFHEGDQSVCFWDAVIWFLRFVEHDYSGCFPWVHAAEKASI